MEIPPITITFDTSNALRHLEMLAEAALENPEVVKGIAKLELPLFESRAEPGDFENDSTQKVTVSVFANGRLRSFLRGLGKIGPQDPTLSAHAVAAIHRTRE